MFIPQNHPKSQQSTNMRSERKARISGLAGTEHARNRTLPDLTFPVTEWDLGTRLGYRQFSCWIPRALAKFCFLRIALNRTKISLY